MVKISKKPIPREPPTFPLFPKLPSELRQIIWTLALPKPRTIMVTSRAFVTYDERMSPVRNFRAGHNAQIVPCVLHVCAESRNLGLKTYQPAFATQLRARPIYFNFQSDTLYMKDSFALESFCGGYSDFEKSGLGGDLMENIRHLALGISCARRKILVELASYERMKTVFLEIPRSTDWRMEAEVENLEAMWRSRLEKKNAENQSQSEGSAIIRVGGQEIDDFHERLPKIQWLTEAKLRQKSNRERVSQSSQQLNFYANILQEARPKGAKRETSPAPYKPPELRSGRFGPRYDAWLLTQSSKN
jgi:hypothetical protein